MHSLDPANMMADGRVRTGRNFTDEQRRRIFENARNGSVSQTQT
jgi:hypothetical protein